MQLGDPGFVAELGDWIRFNPREAMATGDGLYSAASGNPVVPGILGRALLDRVLTPASENARYARQMRATAACAILLGDRADPASWLQVGRACQRLLLAATARDIRAAFVNQPVEVAALRPELAALAGEPALRPDLLIRLGRGPALPYCPPPPGRRRPRLTERTSLFRRLLNALRRRGRACWQVPADRRRCRDHEPARTSSSRSSPS